MTKKSTLSILAGAAILMNPMSAMAWERTNETKVATNGTPLVQMIAERGDTLGEPWLEYLTTIEYDVSGDWWVATAQSLLNFNPQGQFVSGTSYGIAEASRWWFPDLEAIQATAQANANPVMLQSDFIALGEAFASDLAAARELQQESEAKLAQRLGVLEASQATAATERSGLRTDLDDVAVAQDDLMNVTKEGGAIDQRVDSKLTKVTNQVNERLAGVPEMVTNLTNPILTDLTKAGGTIDRKVAQGQSRLLIVGGVTALLILLLVGVTTRLVLRRIRQVDTKLRDDVAQANVKLYRRVTGESHQLNSRLDTIADAALLATFDRAKLDPNTLREMTPGSSFTLTIQAKDGSQQWQPKIERVVYDGGNGPEDRVIIKGLSRRDDGFVQMQPVKLHNAVAKVEEGIEKGRFRNEAVSLIAAE